VKREVEKLLSKSRASQRAAILLLSQSYPDFAASRLYYALFYATQALLLDRGLSFSSHAAVIAAFGREFAKTGILNAKYHRILLDAQDMRNVGDYGIGPSVTPDQVTDLAFLTDDFLRAVETLLID
jgi:uncharacterized protein (UPF0332 family)